MEIRAERLLALVAASALLLVACSARTAEPERRNVAEPTPSESESSPTPLPQTVGGLFGGGQSVVSPEGICAIHLPAGWKFGPGDPDLDADQEIEIEKADEVEIASPDGSLQIFLMGTVARSGDVQAAWDDMRNKLSKRTEEAQTTILENTDSALRIESTDGRAVMSVRRNGGRMCAAIFLTFDTMKPDATGVVRKIVDSMSVQ